MIAVSSSGRSFRALASYLATGRTGAESDRVAWSEGRNIPTDRPELAAEIMHHTAAGRSDERVRQPVYHVAISFDPQDHPTRAEMRQVAHRVLEDLGLGAHQALIVAHGDRAHQHVHILVNRIHPETGRAWDRWQEKARTERSLREQERALGFREVAGRLHRIDGKAVPARAPLTTPERWAKTRSPEPIFVERVRASAPEFRTTASWDALETALAERGLRLERKGQGLVITDGQHAVKASRVHRDLSLRQLEARYGVPYAERDRVPEPNRSQEDRAARRWAMVQVGSPSGGTAVAPVGRYVAGRIRQYERATRLEHALAAAGRALDRAEGRGRAHRAALADHEAAREAFARSLRSMYRDPASAYASFTAAIARDGTARAIQQLRERPETFGSLKPAEQQTGILGRLGVGRAQGDSAVQKVVGLAATRAARMAETGRLVPSGSEREGAVAGLATARARYDRLRMAAEDLPLRGRLVVNVARGMDRLSDQEWAVIRRTIAPREVAIGDAFRDAVRLDRAREPGRVSTAEREGGVASPRERHAQARLAGAAVHRVLMRVAPRELRQAARALEAVGSPGLALKRAIREQVREAILGAQEHAR